ncbi:MAG: hypothetical protein WA900_05670 [Casimicrobiaceae bacterium]
MSQQRYSTTFGPTITLRGMTEIPPGHVASPGENRTFTAEEFLGVAKADSEDPSWRWYEHPENYLPRLPALRLTREAYEGALGEINEVFPKRWAESARPRGSFAVERIPVPYWPRWASFHPFGQFVGAPGVDWTKLAHVLRFGLALHRTAQIPGIRRKRGDLSNLDQYAGAQFEIDLLSDLTLAAYIEARYRGAPFAMAVTRRCALPLEVNDVEDWVPVDVRLHARQPPGGARAAVEELCGRINQAIKDVIHDAEHRGIHAPEFSVEYRTDGPLRTLHFSWGTAEGYAAELTRLIGSTLDEKCAQLRSVIERGLPAFIALDCRSLFPPLIRHAPEQTVRPEWFESALGAGLDFLIREPSINGILWLRQRTDLFTPVHTLVHEFPLMCLQTVESRVNLESYGQLHAALVATAS